MKKLGGATLLILLAAGVWVNSRLPAPHLTAREAISENEEIWATADGESSFITQYLNGKGPQILLSPSLGREASDFNELVASLTNNGYSTITIDPHGVNGANIPSKATLSEFATAVSSNLTSSPARPTILVGHAFGNRVARMTAHQDPENVRAVILLAAGGQVPMEPKAEQSLKNIFNPLRSYKSRMKDVEYAFFADGNEVPAYWKRGWHTKTAMTQAKAVASNANDNSWHCAGGVPMLIVQPMQDRIAPIENAYALKEKCPQEVEIVEVQNAGHALLPEQPEAVAKAVLDFLAKHHTSASK